MWRKLKMWWKKVQASVRLLFKNQRSYAISFNITFTQLSSTEPPLNISPQWGILWGTITLLPTANYFGSACIMYEFHFSFRQFSYVREWKEVKSKREEQVDVLFRNMITQVAYLLFSRCKAKESRIYWKMLSLWIEKVVLCTCSPTLSKFEPTLNQHLIDLLPTQIRLLKKAKVNIILMTFLNCYWRKLQKEDQNKSFFFHSVQI